MEVFPLWGSKGYFANSHSAKPLPSVHRDFIFPLHARRWDSFLAAVKVVSTCETKSRRSFKGKAMGEFRAYVCDLIALLKLCKM